MSQPLVCYMDSDWLRENVTLMAHFHSQTRIQIQTLIPNPMAT